MRIKKYALSHYVSLLEKREPFSFARYGDGEFLVILGFVGIKNSNGCTFTQALRDDLLDVLRDASPYHHGMLRVALSFKRVPDATGKIHEFKGRERISKFLEDMDCQIKWVGGDILLENALKGNLFPLIQQIREYRVLYVGNERLRGINMRGAGFFPYVSYIEVPPQNTHTVKDQIVRRVLDAIQTHRIDFVGWSSGLAAKVMINDVYKSTGGQVTQIDFGSIFDGYFSPLSHIRKGGSRSYIRSGGYDWEDLKQRNTGK